MKKIMVIIILMLLGGCGRANANYKLLSLDDKTIWDQYHVNMDVFSERLVYELTDISPFFKMKSSISFNSRTIFHGAFFYFEITENSKPYGFFSNEPKYPIDQFSFEIDDLSFQVIISPITSSPEKSYPWVYITGVNGKLNYYILLELGDNNVIMQNQYNESDTFKLEDREKIIGVLSSIFTRNSS